MMKKKKSKEISPAADSFGDLELIIHSYNEFFDHLIEVIPARFYLPADDADSKPWYQGLSKAAKASLKQKSKENLKLPRRHRFDPEIEPSSAAKLLQTRQISAADFKDGDSQANQIDVEDGKEKSVTYEELRQKLRRKIEALRRNRGEAKSDERKWKFQGNKRKRGVDDEAEESEKGENVNDDDDQEEIIEYGKVRLESEDKSKKKKKMKLSKAKELERANKKQELKRENPSVAERESWKAAANRAMGVKVHDDARLIKESIRKAKRRKEKNAEKWKERVGTREKLKDERQRKRRENIAGRINEKKMRKIAKREKKLMRPGFEGRKEGFITQE